MINKEKHDSSTTPRDEVRWYNIPRHEFLRATEATNLKEGLKVLGRISIREASQLVVANLSDKVETIMLGFGMYSVYHLADIHSIENWHDIFSNPAHTVGSAILLGSTGRLIFLGLTKPIIKSIANTKVKTKKALDAIGPGDDGS